MTTREVHEQAEVAEKKAEALDTSSLARQFHDMKPAERVAVAKEMQAINESRRKANNALPVIEISTKEISAGNAVLEGISYKQQSGARDQIQFGTYATSLSTFDSKGRQKALEVSYLRPGHTKRVEFDTSTGKQKTIDWMYEGGTFKEHTVCDPQTGKPRYSDAVFNDKFRLTRHTEFNPSTGKARSLDEIFFDGTKRHVDYDSDGRPIDKSQKDRSQSYTDSDGPAVGDFERDKPTQVEKDDFFKQTQQELQDLRSLLAEHGGDITSTDPLGQPVKLHANSDGSVIRTEFDPITNQPLAAMEWGDGYRKSTAYDPNTGQKVSELEMSAGGYTYAEFDPVTGSLKSSEIVPSDGPRIRREYDPETGLPVSELGTLVPVVPGPVIPGDPVADSDE